VNFFAILEGLCGKEREREKEKTIDFYLLERGGNEKKANLESSNLVGAL
jgi:hypothetical protein